MKILQILLSGLAILLLLSAKAQAAHKHSEKWYQAKECAKINGRVEVILPDDTRIDCLNELYAIEFDFAPKWAEAIGQALHYGRLSGKKAGIALIIEKPEDEKYYQRIIDNVYFYSLPITVWRVGE